MTLPRPLLLVALLATLALSRNGIDIRAPAAPKPPPVAAIAAPAPEKSVAPAQTPAPKKPSLSDEVRRVQANRLACMADAGKSVDVFASKSWYVPPPPPPPPKPEPPPPPTAPPLPFAYMGSYQEPDGRLILFLTRGERVYTVSPGDVIDGTYRVEAVEAGQLGLTYLPLNIKQSMSIGETS